MKKGILLISIVLMLSSFAMPSDIWEILAGLQLKTHYNEKTEQFDFELIPTEEIKNLDGKMIEIKGFVVLNGKNNLKPYIKSYAEFFEIVGEKTKSICFSIK